MNEYEWEYEDEFETEFEDEGEWELEGELEGEEFLGTLGNFARQQWSALNTPGSWQRNLALRAARAAASRGLPALGAWAGGASGRRVGQSAAQAVGQLIPQREFEFEGEFEDEGEWEDEAGPNPSRRAFQAAMMSHLGHSAANARTEAEAEAFLGALVPMAARLIPRVAPAVMRVAPQLIRSVANVGRTLIRSPAARPLVRAVPGIVRGTVANLARQAAQGQPITPRSAAQTVARQAYRTLATPARARTAVRQARALDRRYHQQVGTGCSCR